MNRHVALLLAGVLTLGASALPLRAAERDNSRLAREAVGLLRKSCSRCHGQSFKVPYLDVSNRSVLVTKAATDGKLFVSPGRPEASSVLDRVRSGDMPLGGPQLTRAQVALLERWIRAGAPFPQAAAPVVRRGLISDRDVLQAMNSYLATVPTGRRPFQRFFSFANVFNDPTIDANTRRLYRAALSKVLNGLHLEPTIVLPKAIDREQAVFAVDLTDLGWDRRNLWDELLKKYPYGLTHRYDRDPALKNLAESVALATGTELPCLRADWFITTATRPPLYHTLLDLPTDVADLEKGLNVDIEKAFLNNQVVRAGVVTSGVSKQNRLIERLPTRFGAYWKSYDFLKNQGKGDLLYFPLGPVFKDNPFADKAFVQAGGEIIFNLPNGMQGYLLVNGKGKRLDEAPSQVVEDPDQVAGSTIIVNGLSCMACHDRGMKRAVDVLRQQSTLNGNDLVKLQRLHPRQPLLERYFAKDEATFLTALDRATGPFLAASSGRGPAATQQKEPIKEVCRRYFGEVTLAQAARELSIDNPQALRLTIARSSRLRQLGLGPLVTGSIKRDAWEQQVPVQTLYQAAAKALGRGTPVQEN
jgi:mono/diheme cytochrome c family protein